MTITTNINGTTVIYADEGKALRRKTDMGPTRITRVALAKSSFQDEWTDCDYAETEEESVAEVIPSPRTFSKLRLEDALFRAGVLDAVDAFIDSQTITNEQGQTMPLRRKYQTANDFSEAHPLFVQFKTALQQALGWTDEQVEAVLAEAAE